MSKLLRVHPVSHIVSLLLIKKMHAERPKDKVRHSATVILSSTAAAHVLILSVLYTAIKWKE